MMKVISCFLGIFITDGALKIALLLHHHFHLFISTSVVASLRMSRGRVVHLVPVSLKHWNVWWFETRASGRAESPDHLG
jgi:hypothetical protein